MLKVTLDTNCLYELESGAPESALGRLAELERHGRITVQVAAMAASEAQQGGDKLKTFSHFETWLAKLPIEKPFLLYPLCYIGLAFWDCCLYVWPEAVEQERSIHQMLFPTIKFEAREHSPAENARGRKKWRNAKCDVQILWCHIHYGGDVFVTRDRNFLKKTKKTLLEAIGAKLIFTPEDAISWIETEVLNEVPL